jgi:iron complex outermembrane receptor protein
MMAPFKKSVLTSAIVLAGTAGSQLALAQGSTTSLVLEEVVVTAQKREETVQDVPISITAMSATDLERRGVQNVGDLINAIPNMGGYEAPGGRGNVSFSLRGIGSGNPSNLSVDPANAMYIDGVYIGKQIGSALDVAEIERVEVLRGPQGTLYGRNSTGGAINFITRKPTGEFGGKFTGTVGTEGLWSGKGTIYTGTLGEIGDGLGALSASFGYQKRERDELYDNTNSNFDDFEDLDREGYRLALRWDVNDILSVDYAYDHSELNELGTAQVMVGDAPLAVDPVTGAVTERSQVLEEFYLGGIAPGLAQMNQFAPLLGLSPEETADRFAGSSAATLNQWQNPGDGSRPSKTSSDINTFSDSEAEGHNLTIALAFDDLGALGSVEFKSITGYREVDNSNFGDLDGTDNTVQPGGAGAVNDDTLGLLARMYGEELSYFGQMAADPSLIPALSPLYNSVQESTGLLWDYIDQYGGFYFTQDQSLDYEQFSQELQMVGTTDRLEYAVGLYYFSDEGENRAFKRFAAPLGGIDATNYDNETEAWAVYAQTTFRPGFDMFDDRLAITLGYRYTEEDKDIKYLYEKTVPMVQQGPFEGTFRINPDFTDELFRVPGVYGEKFDESFDNHSGNVTVAYDVGEASNVFLRWARGYRSGGFNGELFDPEGSLFDEETIDMLELGFKSDVLPAVLRVNGSVFYYEYDDQQVSQIAVDESGRTSSFIGNAGQSERWGAEVEAQWLPTDDLMISLSYAHMSGDFEEYATLEGATTTVNTDDLAKRGSPDNQASIITDWVFMRTDWAEFMAHVEVFWQDESYAAALWTAQYSNEPVVFDDIVLDERTIVNARIGIENVELGNGTLRAALWGKNIFDQDYNTFGVNFANLGPITEQYGEEATFGLDVTYEF